MAINGRRRVQKRRAILVVHLFDKPNVTRLSKALSLLSTLHTKKKGLDLCGKLPCSRDHLNSCIATDRSLPKNRQAYPLVRFLQEQNK